MDSENIITKLTKSLTLPHTSELMQAAVNLSKRYREGLYESKPLSKLERYAYVLARMPATFKATSAVLKQVAEQLPDFMPSSCLDVGAGPATASWAAQEMWSSLSQFHMVEQDEDWIKLGQTLAHGHPHLSTASWQKSDISHIPDFASVDLSIVAYALQEISMQHYQEILATLFAKTKELLVIIEPGTPRGFDNIKHARGILLALGSSIVAPCPHDRSCPLPAADWCHFSTRLERNKIHRCLKEGSLSFEDEKYSYIAVSRSRVSTVKACVIRPPIKRSGHIILDLCTKNNLQRDIVARSKKEQFRQAKGLEWGSLLNH